MMVVVAVVTTMITVVVVVALQMRLLAKTPWCKVANASVPTRRQWNRRRKLLSPQG
jgi:hypothetical protein